jgi:hypothetical protein
LLLQEVILSSRSSSTSAIGKSLADLVLTVPFAHDTLGDISTDDDPPLDLLNLPHKDHWVAFPWGT